MATTDFRHLYLHLLDQEIRHVLDLLKPHLSKGDFFAQLESYFDASEYGIVVEALIEHFAYVNVEMPEEARIQLGILAKVMKIDIDTLVNPGASVAR